MNKSLWIIILIIVIALAWFLFSGKSNDNTSNDVQGDTTEQVVDQNASAPVDESAPVDQGATNEEAPATDGASADEPAQ